MAAHTNCSLASHCSETVMWHLYNQRMVRKGLIVRPGPMQGANFAIPHAVCLLYRSRRLQPRMKNAREARLTTDSLWRLFEGAANYAAIGLRLWPLRSDIDGPEARRLMLINARLTSALQ